MSQPRRPNFYRYNNNSFYRRQQPIHQFTLLTERNAQQQQAENTRSTDVKKWSIADKIALWGLLVNIILALVTYLLYTLSVNAAYSAKLSAEAAKKSADLQSEALKRDSVNRIKEDSSDRVKSLKSDSVFEYQKRSLIAQIDALKETQKEFGIENKPFIQVNPVSIDLTNVNKRTIVQAELANFGNQPAKLLKLKYKSVYSELPNYNDLNFSRDKEVDVNMYLSGNSHFPITVFSDYPDVTEESIYKLRIGKGFQYFMGEANYINTVTGQRNFYRFNFRISLSPNFNIRSISESTKSMSFNQY